MSESDPEWCGVQTIDETPIKSDRLIGGKYDDDDRWMKF